MVASSVEHVLNDVVDLVLDVVDVLVLVLLVPVTGHGVVIVIVESVTVGTLEESLVTVFE